MIIDINAYLGHYPFRQLRTTEARALVAHMRECGIDMAVVSHLHSVFYRDCHQGNLELFDEIGSSGGRLVPVAAVNPRYPGWERDLAECVERGTKAIALWPENHGYQLLDEHGRSALQRIAEADLPVVLTQRLEDRRQRHHWDAANDLSLSTVLEAAAAWPQLRFVLSNWIGLDGSKMRAAGLKGRCLIDFARLHVLMLKDVPELIEFLGPEAIAFGSHIPFDYVGPSQVKLSNLELLLPEAYEQFAWKNAAEFLRLELPRDAAAAGGS